MDVKRCGDCDHLDPNNSRPLHAKLNVFGYLCKKRGTYYVSKGCFACLEFDPRAIYGVN